MIARKAGKKIVREEVVAIQVQNPDGVTTAEFGFFTGLTLNYQATASTGVTMEVDQRFLIYFNDPGLRWRIRDFFVPDIVEYVGGPLLPEAQGLFQTKQRGYTYLRMYAEGICPPNCIQPFIWGVNITVD